MIPVVILLFMVHYKSCANPARTVERLNANASPAHQNLLLARLDPIVHFVRIEIAVLFVEAHRRVLLPLEDLDLVDFAKLVERFDQTALRTIIGNVLHEDSTSHSPLVSYISNSGRDEFSRGRVSSRSSRRPETMAL